MTTRIPVFPTSPDRTDSITLGGVRVRYRLRWSQRARGWYLWVYQPDGTVVSSAHAVRPGAPATWDSRAPGHPPGQIRAVGSGDGTDRYDLGSRVELWYIPRGDS